MADNKWNDLRGIKKEHLKDSDFREALRRDPLVKDAYKQNPDDTFWRAKRAIKLQDTEHKAWTSENTLERLGARFKLGVEEFKYDLLGQYGEALRQSKRATTKQEAKMIKSDFFKRVKANLLEETFGIFGEAAAQRIRNTISSIRSDDPRQGFMQVKKTFISVLDYIKNIESTVVDQNKIINTELEKIHQEISNVAQAQTKALTTDEITNIENTVEKIVDTKTLTFNQQLARLQLDAFKAIEDANAKLYEENHKIDIIKEEVTELKQSNAVEFAKMSKVLSEFEELKSEIKAIKSPIISKKNTNNTPLSNNFNSTLFSGVAGLGAGIAGLGIGAGAWAALKRFGLKAIPLVGVGAGAWYLADKMGIFDGPSGNADNGKKLLEGTDNQSWLDKLWGNFTGKNTRDKIAQLKRERDEKAGVTQPQQEIQPESKSSFFGNWFGNSKSTVETTDDKIERARVEQAKSRFMQFGALPSGFEFIQGHMGRLGEPAAIAASGAQPLAGGDASPYFPAIPQRSSPYSSGGRQGGYGHPTSPQNIERSTAESWKSGGGFSSDNATATVLSQQRAKFFTEMDNDPHLKGMVQNLLIKENSNHPEGPLERMMNAAHAKNRTLKEELYSGFYGPINRGEVSSKLNPISEAAFARVKAGSNDIDFRTDQGMVNEHKWADRNPEKGRKAEVKGEWYSHHGEYGVQYEAKTRQEIAELEKSYPKSGQLQKLSLAPQALLNATTPISGSLPNIGQLPIPAEGPKGTWNRFSKQGINPYSVQSDITKVETPYGNIQAHKSSAVAFQGFFNDLNAAGAPLDRLGSLNIRPKRWGGGWSEHSYGNAVDLDDTVFYSKKFQNWLNENPGKFEALKDKWGIVHGMKHDPAHIEFGGTLPKETVALLSKPDQAIVAQDISKQYQTGSIPIQERTMVGFAGMQMPPKPEDTNPIVPSEVIDLRQKPLDKPVEAPTNESPIISPEGLDQGPSSPQAAPAAPSSPIVPPEGLGQTHGGSSGQGGSHQPETREPAPGSGGRGAYGRCFI